MITKQILRSGTKFLFVLFAMSVLLTSCNKTAKTKIVIDKGFTNYISGFTSGIISNADALVIELSEDRKEAAKDVDVNKLFSFTPKIAGKASWTDKNEITFTPDDKLPAGQQYEATFDLSKVMEVPDKYKTFKYSFQTKTQSVDVYLKGMSSYSAKNFKWNRVDGDIETADFVDNDVIEEIVSATQKSKRKTIRWQHYPELKKHHFVIDSILRGDNESEVFLQWNVDKMGVKKSGLNLPKSVEIPAIGNFSVMSVKVTNEPEQLIEIFFSDPVSTKQNIRGLVFVKGKRVRTSVVGNKIKIYPRTRIRGDANLYIEKTLRNTMSVKLGKAFTKKIKFVSLKPDIKSVVKGVIMPNSKGLNFPFQAVSLKAVNVKIIKIFEDNVPQFFQVNQYNGKRELTRVGRIVYNKEVQLKSDKAIDYGAWNTFALDLSEMIKVDQGSVYRVELSFNKKQSLWKCNGTGES